jgi:hypothetical protein
MAKKLNFKRVHKEATKGAKMAKKLKGGSTAFDFGANTAKKRRGGFGGGS